MPRKRFSVEQIINHLREADVRLAQGETVGEICRGIGVSEQSYCPTWQSSVVMGRSGLSCALIEKSKETRRSRKRFRV